MDGVASAHADTRADLVGGVVSSEAASAVSWSAIIAGAVAAIAVALVIATLAAGLGLASLSPWPNSGASAVTFTISAGIALIIIHWFASAAGGFITGRLRTKWSGVHSHEVFFRDTAHGLLSWALATLVGTVFIASAFSSIVDRGAHAMAGVAAGAARGVGQGVAESAGSGSQGLTSELQGYDIDRLFRSDRPDQAADAASTRSEAEHIVASALRSGDVPAADRSYLSQLVANRTGVSPADAQARVNEFISRVQAVRTTTIKALDDARKSAMEFAIFTALAMLIGAFIASAAAAYGGGIRFEEQRDLSV